jgi:hypothetical protein
VAVRKLGVKEQETLAVADAISRLKIEAKMPIGL